MLGSFCLYKNLHILDCMGYLAYKVYWNVNFVLCMTVIIKAVIKVET